jgi:hypothetical protein
VVDVGPIGQDHVSKGACVLVLAVGLDGNVLPKDEGRDGVLRVVAVSLALLRAVDAAQADAFSVVAVQDFEGVAVKDLDYLALILRDSNSRRGC